MENNNRNYLIFNVSELNKIDFEKIHETSLETLRYSADNSKTFIKWDNDLEPDFISNLLTKEGPYIQEEILQILSTDFWIDSKNIMS
jgi:hypothetical protein